MPGFLAMTALLAFVATVTGLLLAGIIHATLAVDDRAARRRTGHDRCRLGDEPHRRTPMTAASRTADETGTGA